MNLKAIVLAGAVLTAVLGAAAAPAYAVNPQPNTGQSDSGGAPNVKNGDDSGSGIGAVRPAKGVEGPTESAPAKPESASGADNSSLNQVRQNRSKISADFNPFSGRHTKLPDPDIWGA
ncbi:hypothetical protein AB0L00_09165 [Actinoallomurus sp. NPDC052308]|uniref:hypothetical protein n=1 Tax=Actinoallomurus sp. NPDC052308 TaxID=3155530 RepID=UPI003443EE35